MVGLRSSPDIGTASTEPGGRVGMPSPPAGCEPSHSSLAGGTATEPGGHTGVPPLPSGCIGARLSPVGWTATEPERRVLVPPSIRLRQRALGWESSGPGYAGGLLTGLVGVPVPAAFSGSNQVCRARETNKPRLTLSGTLRSCSAIRRPRKTSSVPLLLRISRRPQRQSMSQCWEGAGFCRRGSTDGVMEHGTLGKSKGS